MHIGDLIMAIKKRPLFFLLNYSIYDLDSFLRGYQYYQFAHGVDKTDADRDFEYFKNIWLKNKLKLQAESADYLQCLMFKSTSPADALDKFFEYWQEFANTENAEEEY